jgi:hypothetical protein
LLFGCLLERDARNVRVGNVLAVEQLTVPVRVVAEIDDVPG